MTTGYLSNAEAKDSLAEIRSAAAAASHEGPSSPFNKFFSLRACQKEGELVFGNEPVNGADKEFRICNLVLKGGGTLGLAHAGLVAGLEAANIRFAGLAGASAGSIVALGIAAARGGDLIKSVTDDLVRATAEAPLDWFIDGPRPIRMLIKHMLLKRSPSSPLVWYGVFWAWRRLKLRRGLNPGEQFERWLEHELARLGAPTLQVLYQHLEQIRTSLSLANKSEAERSDAASAGDPKDLLKIITSVMPLGVKFELPRDMKYLAYAPAETSPARMARMSMAIPAFFDPVHWRIDEAAWCKAPFLKRLGELFGPDKERKFGELSELTFIDGGVFSNLPAEAFTDLRPSMPTILAPIVNATDPERFQRENRGSSALKDVLACIGASRLQRDVDSYIRLRSSGAWGERIGTAPIDTGDANWLNFVMSEGEKIELFNAGLKAAQKFLEGIRNGK